MLFKKLCFSKIILPLIASLYRCSAQLMTTPIIPQHLVESVHTADFRDMNTDAANLFAHYAAPHNTGPAFIASMPSQVIPRFLKDIYNQKINTNPENKAIHSKETLESVDSKRITGVPLNYNKFEESDGVDISTRITLQPVKLKSTIKQISAIDSNDSPRLLKSKLRAHHTHRSERIPKPTTIAKPKNKVIITSTQIPISPIPVKFYSLRTTDQPMTTQQPIQQEFHQQFQSQRHQMLEQNQQQTQQQQQQQQQQQPSTLTLQTSQPLQPQRLRQHLRKHLSKSEKRDQMTSDSSEDSYQYNFYDQTKNQNYLSNQQTDDPINSYSPLKYETYSLENPETYQYYSNAEPEPEPEPEVSRHYGETNDGFTQPLNIYDKNSIKILLEQFVRQLDFLKSVAERELNKANSQTIGQNDYNYKDSTKDYGNDDVVEPLTSNNAASYREHQNERSLEQTSANYMAKELKDTNQKNGRGLYSPCPKSHYSGAHHY